MIEVFVLYRRFVRVCLVLLLRLCFRGVSMASVGLLTKTAAKTVYGVHVRPYVLSPLRVYHQRLRWLGVTTDAPNILPNDGVFGQSYRHHVHRALPPSSAPPSSAAAAPPAASAPPSTLVSLLLAIGLSGCGGGGGSDPKSGDSAGVSDETGIPALGTVGANDPVDAAMPERSSVVQERAATPILSGEKTGEDQTGDDGGGVSGQDSGIKVPSGKANIQETNVEDNAQDASTEQDANTEPDPIYTAPPVIVDPPAKVPSKDAKGIRTLDPDQSVAQLRPIDTSAGDRSSGGDGNRRPDPANQDQAQKLDADRNKPRTDDQEDTKTAVEPEDIPVLEDVPVSKQRLIVDLPTPAAVISNVLKKEPAIKEPAVKQPAVEQPPIDAPPPDTPPPETGWPVVAGGDHSAARTNLVIIGGDSLDVPTVSSPHGGVLNLNAGGSVRNPQLITLGDGVEHIIYAIGHTNVNFRWQPSDGVQSWVRDMPALLRGILEGSITYETRDSSDDGDPDHDLLTSATIASPVHRVFNQSSYQMELHVHQQDDQRSSFDILRQKKNDYERGNLETFYQIMGNSFALINEWEDLGLGANLPPSDQLPPII